MLGDYQYFYLNSDEKYKKQHELKQVLIPVRKSRFNNKNPSLSRIQ
jgi:hypothetical protein